MKALKNYKNSIEFIKDLPEFMLWWSLSLKKRGIIDRKVWDIDVVVPASFWWLFKEMEYTDYFETNRYGSILPEWIFIYSHIFKDWSIDLIFRKDYSELKFDVINWYKHLDIHEILNQKKHLLENWNWDCESKHKDDINKIKQYLLTT